jgi:predicted AAA+ superfamily ATPase
MVFEFAKRQADLHRRNSAETRTFSTFGSMWEQIVLSNIKGHLSGAEVFYYRSSGGAEIDFVVKTSNAVFAVECKASFSPSLSKGNYSALEDIKPNRTFVVIPAEHGWPLKNGIDVVSLSELQTLLSPPRSY